MNHTPNKLRRTAAALALTVSATLGVAGIAGAAPSENGREHGRAHAESESSDERREAELSGSDHDGDADNDALVTTEDTDTNDGGTLEDVADEGDNLHPSGRDRSVENGNSDSNPNQGNSESDPDDDGRGPDRTNGGPDKPGGDGGLDPADQDGNNGCGNDDDFEDDNEGWCGRRDEATTPPVTPPAAEAGEISTPVDSTPVVLGDTTEQAPQPVLDAQVDDVSEDTAPVPGDATAPVPAAPLDVTIAPADTDTPDAAPEVQVLGVVIERGPLAGPDVLGVALAPAPAGVAGEALARTGVGTLWFAIAGAFGIAAGAILVRRASVVRVTD